MLNLGKKVENVKKIVGAIWSGGFLIGLGIIFLFGFEWPYILILTGILIIITSVIKYLFSGEGSEERSSSS